MNKLRRLLEKEPLLHVESTLTHLDEHQITAKSYGAVYYGTGLATRQALSVGLPFDVLILVLIGEFFRREFRLIRTFHHIADTHALSNSFCGKADVDRIASEYRKVIESVGRIVGAPLAVKLSSEFDATPEYGQLLEKVKTDKVEYVRRELADILWYRWKHRVRLKIGWLIQEEVRGSGFDERLFDDEFLAKCDKRMSFAYTLPGKTFDRHRLRVPPYIAIPGENRILFKKGEDVRKKYLEADSESFPNQTTKGMIEHLTAIMRLWDKLSLTPIPEDDDVLRRVQTVIDLVCSE